MYERCKDSLTNNLPYGTWHFVASAVAGDRRADAEGRLIPADAIDAIRRPARADLLGNLIERICSDIVVNDYVMNSVTSRIISNSRGSRAGSGTDAVRS